MRRVVAERATIKTVWKQRDETSFKEILIFFFCDFFLADYGV